MEALNDMYAGFVAMPGWAQVGVSFFALMFLYMAFETPIAKRRHRRQLAIFADALGAPAPQERNWPYSTTASVSGRLFTLTYDYRMRNQHTTYRRGPTGHVLVIATPMAGSGWSMHQVDVSGAAGWLSRLTKAIQATGDPAFDARLIVIQDGLPVRTGWLDAPTRAALLKFFADAPQPEVIWIREGVLQSLVSSSWKGLKDGGIRKQLEAQAVLADALERSAGARFREN